LIALVLALVVATSSSASGQDELEVEASRSGFTPRVLSLKKGETVRLSLSTADEEHCFAVDSLRVEKRIVPGRATKADVTPDRAGSFPFYCCLEPDNEALRGRIEVTE
jgi:heme/copper-type cytochrome/quinol oxidase subunit 2